MERSQKTDKTEFYPTVDLRSNELDDLLAEWQHYYNWERPHSANNGKTPIDKYIELSEDTPFSDVAFEDFDPVKERYQNANYKIDLELKRLKRCL